MKEHILGQKQPLLTPQQLFDKLRVEKLAKTVYPHQLSEEIKTLLHKCMQHTSINKLGCGVNTYNKLINFNGDFYFTEIDLILKIILAASPIELGQTLQENYKMITEIYVPLFEQALEVDKKISKEVQNEIEVKQKISGNSPLGKRLVKSIHE